MNNSTFGWRRVKDVYKINFVEMATVLFQNSLSLFLTQNLNLFSCSTAPWYFSTSSGGESLQELFMDGDRTSGHKLLCLVWGCFNLHKTTIWTPGSTTKKQSSLCSLWTVVEDYPLNLWLFSQHDFFALSNRDWEFFILNGERSVGNMFVFQQISHFIPFGCDPCPVPYLSKQTNWVFGGLDNYICKI